MLLYDETQLTTRFLLSPLRFGGLRERPLLFVFDETHAHPVKKFMPPVSKKDMVLDSEDFANLVLVTNNKVREYGFRASIAHAPSEAGRGFLLYGRFKRQA